MLVSCTSTALKPRRTLDPYCCPPCILRGEDKVFWLTQCYGCSKWVEREWEKRIHGKKQREWRAVVPSCGCACATQVPARSTICSSQDTGALSGGTNTNALSLSSPPSQHVYMSTFSVWADQWSVSKRVRVQNRVSKRKRMGRRSAERSERGCINGIQFLKNHAE